MRVEEELDRVFLFIGDELGFLKLWDLTSVISLLGVQKCVSHKESKGSFNPTRSEVIDCSVITNQLREASLRNAKPMP